MLLNWTTYGQILTISLKDLDMDRELLKSSKTFKEIAHQIKHKKTFISFIKDYKKKMFLDNHKVYTTLFVTTIVSLIVILLYCFLYVNIQK